MVPARRSATKTGAGDAVGFGFGATKVQISHKTMFLEGPKFWPYPWPGLPGWPWLTWLALACLAFLASHRPRSPCLHLATTAWPPSAAGRRGAPLLLLLVQVTRARPMRGEVSQASQGLVRRPTTNYDELRRKLYVNCTYIVRKMYVKCM